MQIKALYIQLKEAYAEENLNALSSTIISLYKNQNEAVLRRIYSLIYAGMEGAEDPISRIFSKIIMHYHPDRTEQLNQSIEQYMLTDDIKGLESLGHILDVQKVDVSQTYYGSYVDSDFDYEDLWDYSAGGYSYIDTDEHEKDEYDVINDAIMSHDFMTAVKRKVYGFLNVEFPVNLLADMEIIEMAEYEIEHLDGIEYCTYARIVDLSGNNITEVTQLGFLLRLEEAYLQNNQISYLDGLDDLPYLRILDISFNDIDDLSLLLESDTLEFINVIGNRIPNWQLELLSKRGVVVVA
ncbi:leucine-rich repeat domain-containing protein [Bacteroidota bacterium]